jgi:hypothetical protein
MDDSKFRRSRSNGLILAVLSLAVVSIGLLAARRFLVRGPGTAQASAVRVRDRVPGQEGPSGQTETADPTPGAAGADWVFVDGRRFPAKPPPLPRLEYHPRDQGEWQGMLVDVSVRATCETSALCGLALACVKNLCSPCESDSDCALREVCVLDHCVRRDKVACRRRTDCGSADEYCVLTGFSSDPRGNRDMRAVCQAAHGKTWLGNRETPPSPATGSSARAKEPVSAALLREITEANP